MLNQLIYEADMTMTENGAATYRTTGSDCLDLFAAAGALRRADDEEIIIRFVRAYTEDPDIAMRILFYARDVRGGLGERRIFRAPVGQNVGDSGLLCLVRTKAPFCAIHVADITSGGNKEH